jgi:hypothetical protein
VSFPFWHGINTIRVKVGKDGMSGIGFDLGLLEYLGNE